MQNMEEVTLLLEALVPIYEMDFATDLKYVI